MAYIGVYLFQESDMPLYTSQNESRFMLSKEQLLHNLADEFEKFIVAALEANQRASGRNETSWGPRQLAAHLAGWEIIATVRIPEIAAGMLPFEYKDDAQQEVMNNAINAVCTSLIGDQSLAAVCDILQQAYRRDIAMLERIDNRFFQPGEYVYERTLGVIDHCREHILDLTPDNS